MLLIRPNQSSLINHCAGVVIGGGEGFQENLGGGVRHASKILTLFMTKICDVTYGIYDLTKNLKPYLSPDS